MKLIDVLFSRLRRILLVRPAPSLAPAPAPATTPDLALGRTRPGLGSRPSLRPSPGCPTGPSPRTGSRPSPGSRGRSAGQTALEFLLILGMVVGILALVGYVAISIQHTGLLGVKEAKTNFECGLSKMYLGSYNQNYDGTNTTAPQMIGVHGNPLHLAWPTDSLPDQDPRDSCKLNGYNMSLYFMNGFWRVYLANASGGWFVYAGVGDSRTVRVYPNGRQGGDLYHGDACGDSGGTTLNKLVISSSNSADLYFDVDTSGDYKLCIYIWNGGHVTENLTGSTLISDKDEYYCTTYVSLDSGDVAVDLSTSSIQSSLCWGTEQSDDYSHPPYLESQG